MAAQKKVRIDLDPKAQLTFVREVAIPTPDGTALKVPFTFKRRSRTEMGYFLQARIERAREYDEQRKQAEASGAAANSAFASSLNEYLADSLLDVAADWGVEDYEFTRENLVKFCDIFPGAADAVFEDYRRGMLEGRLGN